MPLDDSAPLLTPTETTQGSRADVVRWADTLTEAYVQGAFKRAVIASADSPPRLVTRPTLAEAAAAEAIDAVRGELPDPFDLYASGETAMRRRLSALSRSTLLELIATYGLNPAGKSLSWLNHRQLVTFIVTAVEVQESSGLRGRPKLR